MAENDVSININVDAKNAQKSIEDFGKSTKKSLGESEKQSKSFFDVFKANAGKITTVIAGVVGGFSAIKKGINLAVEDAKLARQIEASLLSVGEASKSAVDDIIDFANALKATTGVSDDAVKAAFITAQNFGITTDKAKELTAAAVDLAAATGQDLDSAVRLLGNTLDGSVGKLGRYGAEFRNLTKEQLESGAAIDLVAKKFSGAAERDLNSFSGRLAQLNNSFEDFLKVIGKIITESRFVQKSLELTAKGIDKLTNAVEKFQKQPLESTIGATLKLIKPLNMGLSLLGESYADASVRIKAAREELEAFRDIRVGGQSRAIADGFAGIVKQAQGSTSATSDFISRLNSFPVAKVQQDIGLTGKALEDFKKKAQAAKEEFEKFKSSILSGRGTDREKILEKQKQDLATLAKFEKNTAFKNSKEISELKIKINEDTAEQLKKLDEKAAEEARKTAKEIGEKASKEWQDTLNRRRRDFDEGFANPIQASLENIFNENGFSKESIGGIIGGSLNQVLQGKEGARQFAANIAGAIGDFILPGIGGIVTQIAGLLAQGPEEVKKLINEFIKYVPEFIAAIADSIPVVVERLIDVLLFEGGLERIIGALLRAVPRISIKVTEVVISALVKGIPAIAAPIAGFLQKTIDLLFKSIPKIFKPLTDVFEGFRNLVDRLFGPINDLIKALKNAIPGGKGGGRGLIAETFDRWFSKGGLVYAADGFFKPRGTDTVPAMLTPGELVVPRDMVGELGAFLMSQKDSNPGSDSALLSAIYSAVNSPIIVQTEAKVNQQAFADIILKLNRQNARLSA